MAPRHLDPPARCWLCGSTDAAPYRKVETWHYVRCRECGLVFLFPRPTATELTRLYEQSYLDDGKGRGHIDFHAIADARVAANGERVAFLNGLRPPGRLLEIGCGAGFFLEAARRSGWECSGLDVSPESLEFARRRFGLDVREGAIEDGAIEPGRFDAATMLHTLEHLPDPARTLREARRALRPGGVLYVEVPNLASPDAVLRKALRDRVFLAPFHLFAFTPATLRRFLTQAGYAEIVTQPFVSGLLSREIARGKTIGHRLVRHLIPVFRRPGGGDREATRAPRKKKSDTAVARVKRVVQRLLPGHAMYAWAVNPS